MDKKATTDFPLAEPLAHRHSPRAFDPESELTDEQIGSLLEAARWSASSSNSQPWRLYVARRGTNLHREVFGTLASKPGVGWGRRVSDRQRRQNGHRGR